ncbi:MAG: F0F1 ATP synthase subunit B [Gemmatimonadota bacterium]|nr:F0F1 ATP synthase subunit B [Gemmatimonadota bacterium]
MSSFATGDRSARTGALSASSAARTAHAATVIAATLLATVPAQVFAQEEAHGPVNLLEPNVGLMFWTLLIFFILFLVLARYAYKPLFALVEAREKSLEDAVEGAKRDREAAAAHLATQLASLETAKVEAQRIIADSRQTAEKVRADLLEQTKAQQGEMLASARRAIESEKVTAIAEMRAEAVELAIAGASKVIDRNLDSASNRQIVEGFLASLNTQPAKG